MFEIWFDVKRPENGWYAVKQNNQPTIQSIKLRNGYNFN